MSFGGGNPYEKNDLSEVYRHFGITNEDCKRFEAMNMYANNMQEKYTLGMPGFDDILKGNYYRDGIGFPQDYRQAYQHYLKAAREGNPEAMFNLGKMYRNGYGVDKRDCEIALKWFTKAANTKPLNKADTSIAEAENAIGELYLNGQGVERDIAKAAEWFKKAIDKGFEKAVSNLEKLYKVEPSLLPPLEKIKRDPKRKAYLLQNREKFVDIAKKFEYGKSSKIEPIPFNSDLTKWTTAKKIAFKEMDLTNKVYDEYYLEVRIIDWPFLKASIIQTVIEDENGQSQRLEIACSFNGKENDKMLQALKTFYPNVKISILNPHMKLMKDGENCIRVDKPGFIKLDNSGVVGCCHVCGKAAAVQSCGACLMAKYCSKECQKHDWIEFKHKKICKHLQIFRGFM